MSKPVGGFKYILAIIAILFLILEVKVKSDNSTPFTIEIDNSDGVVSVNGISVTLESSQQWWSDNTHGLSGHAESAVGAEFDGVITNNLDYPIQDWTLTVVMPAEAIIDSSWNGDFENDKDEIIVVPDQYINEIPEKSHKTFGFVIYTTRPVELNHFIITGTVHKTIEDFMLFWILVITMFVCAIVQVVYLIMSIRIRNLEREQRKNEQIISQTMSTFAEFIDAKDPYTRGHSARVSFYSGEIARRMKMSEDEVKKLEYIALMHDCGKIGIPDNILKKPDKLEPEERKIIESHTTIGGHMLEKYTAIEGIRDGAMYHHERYDGKGYPEGRKGEEIPLYARIIGIADAFDAMNSDRCYRKHLSKEVILKELEENKGKQFDPDLAEYMIEMIKDGSIIVLGEGENEGEDKRSEKTGRLLQQGG
jgi:hypothetical protein